MKLKKIFVFIGLCISMGSTTAAFADTTLILHPGPEGVGTLIPFQKTTVVCTNGDNGNGDGGGDHDGDHGVRIVSALCVCTNSNDISGLWDFSQTLVMSDGSSKNIPPQKSINSTMCDSLRTQCDAKFNGAGKP